MNSFAWFMPARHDYRLVAGDSDGIRWSAQASTAYPIRKLLLKTALICLLVVSSFLAGQLSIPVPKAERDKAIPRRFWPKSFSISCVIE